MSKLRHWSMTGRRPPQPGLPSLVGRKPPAQVFREQAAEENDAQYALRLLVMLMRDERQPIELRFQCAQEVLRHGQSGGAVLDGYDAFGNDEDGGLSNVG